MLSLHARTRALTFCLRSSFARPGHFASIARALPDAPSFGSGLEMHPTTPHSRQNAKPSTPTCPRAVTFKMSKLAPFAHSVYFTDSGNGLIGGPLTRKMIRPVGRRLSNLPDSSSYSCLLVP